MAFCENLRKELDLGADCCSDNEGKSGNMVPATRLKATFLHIKLWPTYRQQPPPLSHLWLSPTKHSDCVKYASRCLTAEWQDHRYGGDPSDSLTAWAQWQWNNPAQPLFYKQQMSRFISHWKQSNWWCQMCRNNKHGIKLPVECCMGSGTTFQRQQNACSLRVPLKAGEWKQGLTFWVQLPMIMLTTRISCLPFPEMTCNTHHPVWRDEQVGVT